MSNFALIVFALFALTIARADNCGQIFVKGLTDEEKQFIVNKHNEIRSWIVGGKVPGQPKGKNLNVIIGFTSVKIWQLGVVLAH
ncbi:hypothetical protein TcasGA2_TC000597 [Tribolium castaneum]|uniref:Uncharacterized protein n=1 Tax=Tribolium castaneum TaxID=7070 RepID=D6W9E9_TRICA|nr:hypothetical protein TcasGA2_TC000597 [Tribolium castaneum]